MSLLIIKKPSVDDQVEITIDRISFHGGRGVGRHNNFVIFTPFTAPGDQVLVKIVEVKKKFAVAKLIKIIKTSPQRQDPKCEYFETCGGCSLQHINYKTQLEEKNNILVKTLSSLSDFIPSLLTNIQASEKEFFYRNRVKLQIKNNQFGYFQHSSHDFIPISSCVIAHEDLQGQIKKGPEKNNDSREQELSLSKNKNFFLQVSEGQNDYLIKNLQNYVSKNKFNQIFDLYCGSGNFTFPIRQTSDSKVEIFGVESSTNAIDNAKKTRSAKPIKFICSDVQNYLKNLNKVNQALFVFDPPRSGLNSSIIGKTLQLLPKAIVYISCNPTTLVRDLKLILESQPTYKLKFIQGVDMFPQTSHIECICIIERNS